MTVLSLKQSGLSQLIARKQTGSIQIRGRSSQAGASGGRNESSKVRMNTVSVIYFSLKQLRYSTDFLTQPFFRIRQIKSMPKQSSNFIVFHFHRRNQLINWGFRFLSMDAVPGAPHGRRFRFLFLIKNTYMVVGEPGTQRQGHPSVSQ